MMSSMWYCTGYEDKERVVDAIGFQMGQAGTGLVQTHAVEVEAGCPADTAVCGMPYSRVNDSLDWFHPKYISAYKRCAECENRTQ
jgi:hypothetical protein